ncbi:hypothetical protein ENSA5_15770 [Enhygromyxa salina]|uniref:Uncharacterized protein n=1 Tax=Enhygromyxa salina TaxID=215803 RepID=A0A2S9YEL1_9BACT|nr:hypothetical protein [Enhygromyxa salina]PRQ03451.1 hypothetical protein ENSA5_15770 [Enhygromyxa salina]
MIAPEDSLVVPARASPLRAIVALVAFAAVAAAGWWMLGRSKGQPEDPARVLIVGPTPELADFLEREGFDVDQLSVGEAIGEGQSFDTSLDELAAIVEYADQRGFGYVALNMAHGEQYDFSTVGYEAEAPPPGTTFAVMSVGDLGQHLSYGGVVPDVTHTKPAGERVGLLLALFGQEQIAKARTREADNDLMIRFGSAGTVADVVEIEQGQETMRRQIAAWAALAERERGEPKPSELARAYETLRAWPLANGALLLASGRGAWHSEDGRETAWRSEKLEAELTVVTLDELGPDQRQPCATLPETLSLDGGFAVAPAGDALLIPSDRWVADLWVLSGEGCSFEKRDPIRRLDGGELGLPRASGRTAASLGGRLMWADAKMRAYRQVRIEGVELRHQELRWTGEDSVVVPAGLDFVDAATARARRVAEASASEAPSPPDPATLPSRREALVFVVLPPPEQVDELRVAVVPVDALAPDAGEPSTLAIRDAFPLPAASAAGLAVVALVDTPAGSRLIQATVPHPGAGGAELWRNALADDYELASAASSAQAAIETKVLATDLPHEAHDLAISPTGSHAAWAAPFGEAPGDEPLANFEIVVLPLGVEAAAPKRLTDNDRSDLRPRFAGRDGGVIVFDSAYAGAEPLPELEAVRAIVVPR